MAAKATQDVRMRKAWSYNCGEALISISHTGTLQESVILLLGKTQLIYVHLNQLKFWHPQENDTCFVWTRTEPCVPFAGWTIQHVWSTHIPRVSFFAQAIVSRVLLTKSLRSVPWPELSKVANDLLSYGSWDLKLRGLLYRVDFRRGMKMTLVQKKSENYPHVNTVVHLKLALLCLLSSDWVANQQQLVQKFQSFAYW